MVLADCRSFHALVTTTRQVPSFGWRLQLSDSICSSLAEQAKPPAELWLKLLSKYLYQINYCSANIKTGHYPRCREKTEINGLFLVYLFFCERKAVPVQ